MDASLCLVNLADRLLGLQRWSTAAVVLDKLVILQSRNRLLDLAHRLYRVKNWEGVLIVLEKFFSFRPDDEDELYFDRMYWSAYRNRESENSSGTK